MKFGPDDRFWVVTDPTDVSELADICFASSLRNLLLQFKGGLTLEDRPTIFTDEAEARKEAERRLRAARSLGDTYGSIRVEPVTRPGKRRR